MKFEFKINKYYLVGHSMASKKKPFPAWEKLEEKIWGKYKEEPAYYFLNPRYINWAIENLQTDFSAKNINSVLSRHRTTLEKIYQEIFRTKEFKRLLKETERHLLFIKSQWQKNGKEALKNLKEISGLSTPNHKITVYITHPKLHNGKMLNRNTIACGHREEWENHLTICLCHELLHIMTWPGHFQPNFDILHGIILLSDNEIKIRLNKKGKYFKDGNLNIEPPEFLNLEKKILPYWEKYLSGKLTDNVLGLKTFLAKKLNRK